MKWDKFAGYLNVGFDLGHWIVEYLDGNWTITCIESQLDRNVDPLNNTSTTTQQIKSVSLFIPCI